jgi:hypothetical protein
LEQHADWTLGSKVRRHLYSTDNLRRAVPVRTH